MPATSGYIYAKTKRAIQKEYNDALERAVKKSRDFFKRAEAVQTGRMKPPAGLKTENQIAAWKRGYLQRAAKTEKVVENISSEMMTAGIRSRKNIQEMMVRLFGAESKETLALLDKTGRYGLTPPKSSQISALLRKTSTSFEKVGFKRLGLPGDTAKKLRDEMAIGISKNETNEQLMKRIRKITGGKEYEAMRIARTEHTRICGQAQCEACNDYFQKTGKKPRKIWNCSFVNSRDSHMRMHGEEVDYDQEFSNGLMYPGDPSGAAAEVINCQCYLEVVE